MGGKSIIIEDRRGLPSLAWKRKFWAFFGILLLICSCYGDGNLTGETSSGPDVKVENFSASIDAADIGDIPIGTIPEERILLTIRIKNDGTREAAGYRIKMYLLKEGREDTISAQIGSDLTDTRLGSGESREYNRSYMVPKYLKDGGYRIMILLETAEYFPEENLSNNKYISENVFTIGVTKGPEGTIPIYSPGTLDKPGYYLLKRDINAPNKNNVYKITSSGVTLDGGGNTIQGTSTGFSSAIDIDANSQIRDVVIKNLNIEGFDTGIWAYQSNNGKISGCNLSANKNYGIRLDKSNDNELTGNHLLYNEIGLGIFQSFGNLVYDNYFNNSYNAVVNEGKKNRWNIDPSYQGKNIIDGSIVAGNVWFDTKGTGFSELASDMNGDGIADAPYTLAPDNIDFYPLIPPNRILIHSDIINPDGNTTNSSEILVEKSEETEPEKVDIAPLLPVFLEITNISPNMEEETDEGELIYESSDEQYLDLQITSLIIPEQVCRSEGIPITVQVQNAGGYQADGFFMHYYLSEDMHVNSGDTSLYLDQIDGLLLSGEEKTFEFTIPLPNNIGIKRYFLIAAAELTSDTYERKKDNNFLASEKRILIQDC